MANKLDLNFSAEEAIEDELRGEYTVKIKNATVKENKTGTGTVLTILYEVLSGKAQGEGIFQTLNPRNPNATAVKIYRQEMRKIIAAAGIVLKNNSPEDLVGAKLKITVVPDDRGSKITGYAALGAATGNATGTTQVAAASGGRFASRNKPAEVPVVEAPAAEVEDDDVPY